MEVASPPSRFFHMSRSFDIDEALAIAAKNHGVAVIPDESGNRATAYFLTPAAYQAMVSSRPPVRSKKPTRGERKRRARERQRTQERERQRMKVHRRLFS